MKRPKSVKIYIKTGETIFDFMWANIALDGSVLLELSYKYQERILWTDSEDKERLIQCKSQSNEKIKNPKITFHKSGNYKMASSLQIKPNMKDRFTIIGPPLDEIEQPRRMMDILLPNNLHKTEKQITNRDMILDTIGFPDKQLRCTISCMSLEEYTKLFSNYVAVVATSMLELTKALKDEASNRVWTWTLRVSKNDDVTAGNSFVLCIPGVVKYADQIID